jgi:hypothetical protein
MASAGRRHHPAADLLDNLLFTWPLAVDILEGLGDADVNLGVI